MKGFRPSADNFYTRRRYSIDRSARERDRSSFSRLVYIPRAYYCATVIWPVNRRFRRNLSRRNDLSSSMLRDQFRVFFFFFSTRACALCFSKRKNFERADKGGIRQLSFRGVDRIPIHLIFSEFQSSRTYPRTVIIFRQEEGNPSKITVRIPWDFPSLRLDAFSKE